MSNKTINDDYCKSIYDKINELAVIIAKKRDETGGNNYKLNCSEVTEIYILLLNQITNKYWFDEDIFHDIFPKTLEKYDSSKRDYMPYLKTAMINKAKDNYKKSKKFILESTNSDNKKEDESYSLIDIIEDESSNIFDKVDAKANIEHFYKRLATICIEFKKRSKGKKRVCYPPLFFTDRLLYSIFEVENHLDYIVEGNKNKFDEAVVFEFLNSMITNSCDSVTDIKKYSRRPLSEFTGNLNDNNKSCCEDKPNYYVFNYFIKQNNKSISQSSFSQQKTKFIELIKSIDM